MSEQLAAVFDEFIRPAFIDVRIRRHDGSEENFDPLTLLSSLIESEIDLKNATRIFDDVIAVLKAYTERAPVRPLTHQGIHDAVSQAIRRYPDALAPFWLSNYEGLFASELVEDEGEDDFIDARNAGVLRQEIRLFLQGKRESLQTDNGDLSNITNRIIRLIRYCGFYKVRRNFLHDFLQELSTSSSKAFIPNVAPDHGELNARIELIERYLAVIQEIPAGQHLNFAQMIVHAIASAILGWLGVIYSPDTKQPMRQVRQLLDDLYKTEKTTPGPLTSIRQMLDERFEVAGVKKDFLADIDGLNAAAIGGADAHPADIIYFAERVLRLVKLLVSEDSFDRAFAEYRMGDPPEPYLRALADAFRTNGVPVLSLGERWIDISLQYSFNRILEYGSRLRIFVVEERGTALDSFDFGFIEDWAEETPELAFCVLFQDGLGGQFLENLKRTTRQTRRLIAPVRRGQLERLLLRGDDVRSLVLEDFLHHYPNGGEWQETAVFQVDTPSLPSHLRVRERDGFLHALRSIQSGPLSGSTLQSFQFLESRLREHVFLIYALAQKQNARAVLETAAGEFADGMELNRMVQFLQKLPTAPQGTTKEILALRPPAKVLRELEELRKQRNTFTHNDLSLEPNKAADVVHRAAVLVSYFNFASQAFRKVVSSEELGGSYLYDPLSGALEAVPNVYWPTAHPSGRPTYRFGYQHAEQPGLRFAALTRCSECRRQTPMTAVSLGRRYTCTGCSHNVPYEGDWSAFVAQVTARPATTAPPAMTGRLTPPTPEKETHLAGWLRSLGEGLATALGPAGAPIKVMIEELNRRDMDRIERKIDDLIAAGAAASEARAPLVDLGLSPAQADLLLRWAARRETLTARDGAAAVAPVSGSTVSERELADELSRLYGELDLLRSDFRPFIDLGRVRRTDIPNVDIEYLVGALRGQPVGRVLELAQRLHAANPASAVLANLTNSLAAYDHATETGPRPVG